MPRLEQILLVRPGHDVPEKTSVPLMTGWIFFLRVYLGAVPRSQGGAEREEKKVGDQAWSENILQIKSRNLFDKTRTWIDGFSDRVIEWRRKGSGSGRGCYAIQTCQVKPASRGGSRDNYHVHTLPKQLRH